MGAAHTSLKPCLEPDRIEAGCDEAGRGCLAGPVACAAVILPPGFSHPLLADSKKLTEKQRNILRPIIEREALSWCVVMVSAEEIDRINILQASITGMQRAVSGLTIRPDHILVRHLAEEYPQYMWQQNKAYPTAAHRKAIAEHGPCPYHRKSFRLV